MRILNTYQGRDRVIRTTSYACFLLSGMAKSRTKERLCILGTQLSSCRIMLRLFDDILMLNYNLQYGFGRKEEDTIMRCLSVVCNFADQLFYPVEHVAWAIDQQLITINGTPWWHSSTFLWFLSLYCNLLKVLRSIFLLRRQQVTLLKSDCSRAHLLVHEIQQKMHMEVLSFVEYGADLCNAIHWTPKPFLWAGKLQLWQVGLFGCISSVIGMWRFVKLSMLV